MSTSNTDPVTTAQNIVNTFLKIKRPTMQDLNTLTSGLVLILKESTLTSAQSTEIVSILASVLQSKAATTIVSYKYAAEEISQMSVAINAAFFSAIAPVFGTSSTINQSLSSTLQSLIQSTSESTTSISASDYASLWTSISSALTAAGVSTTASQTIKTQWDATLKLYFNLNTSNYMSKSLSESTINDWQSALMSTLSSTYDLGAYSPDITSQITTIFSSSGLTSAYGMSTGQFINACNVTLALLSTYLTSASIDSIRLSMGSYISDHFLISSTYSDTMALPSSKTLSSTVSFNFTVINLPFTPSLASSYKTSVLSSLSGGPNFTSSQTLSIQDAINSYFSTINITSNGMTAAQTYELWQRIETTITPFLSQTNSTGVSGQLLNVKTSFLNNLQTYILKNVSQILSAKTLVHDGWQEFLFANPSTKTETFTGNYLSNWATDFLSKVDADLSSIESSLLNSCLESLINSNNNVAGGVSGSNFVQIGCEILLWLSNFLTQAYIDQIALQMQDFLLTFVYVSDYVNSVDEALEVLGLIFLIIVIIALTAFAVLFNLEALEIPSLIIFYGLITLIVGELAAGIAVTAVVAEKFNAALLSLVTESSEGIAIACVSGFFITGGFGAEGYTSSGEGN